MISAVERVYEVKYSKSKWFDILCASWKLFAVIPHIQLFFFSRSRSRTRYTFRWFIKMCFRTFQMTVHFVKKSHKILILATQMALNFPQTVWLLKLRPFSGRSSQQICLFFVYVKSRNVQRIVWKPKTEWRQLNISFLWRTTFYLGTNVSRWLGEMSEK